MQLDIVATFDIDEQASEVDLRQMWVTFAPQMAVPLEKELMDHLDWWFLLMNRLRSKPLFISTLPRVLMGLLIPTFVPIKPSMFIIYYLKNII